MAKVAAARPGGRQPPGGDRR